MATPPTTERPIQNPFYSKDPFWGGGESGTCKVGIAQTRVAYVGGFVHIMPGRRALFSANGGRPSSGWQQCLLWPITRWLSPVCRKGQPTPRHVHECISTDNRQALQNTLDCGSLDSSPFSGGERIESHFHHWQTKLILNSGESACRPLPPADALHPVRFITDTSTFILVLSLMILPNLD